MKRANSSKRIKFVQGRRVVQTIISSSGSTKFRGSRGYTTGGMGVKILSKRAIEHLIRKRDEVLYNTEKQELDSMSNFIKATFKE